MRTAPAQKKQQNKMASMRMPRPLSLNPDRVAFAASRAAPSEPDVSTMPWTSSADPLIEPWIFGSNRVSTCFWGVNLVVNEVGPQPLRTYKRSTRECSGPGRKSAFLWLLRYSGEASKMFINFIDIGTSTRFRRSGQWQRFHAQTRADRIWSGSPSWGDCLYFCFDR